MTTDGSSSSSGMWSPRRRAVRAARRQAAPRRRNGSAGRPRPRAQDVAYRFVPQQFGWELPWSKSWRTVGSKGSQLRTETVDAAALSYRSGAARQRPSLLFNCLCGRAGTFLGFRGRSARACTGLNGGGRRRAGQRTGHDRPSREAGDGQRLNGASVGQSGHCGWLRLAPLSTWRHGKNAVSSHSSWTTPTRPVPKGSPQGPGGHAVLPAARHPVQPVPAASRPAPPGRVAGAVRDVVPAG